ncbi:hypothetical protein L9F63_012644, partial [Diploptera punctata]
QKSPQREDEHEMEAMNLTEAVNETLLQRSIRSISAPYDCSRNNIVGVLVQNASAFLFPCTIEYSLICAVTLYEMWKHLKAKPTPVTTYHVCRSWSTNSLGIERLGQHFSVDCHSAHKGLFAGILVLVLTIISLVLFLVLNQDPLYKHLAVFEVSLCEMTLYSVCTLCVLSCMLRIRVLRQVTQKSSSLDSSLLVMAQAGMYVYCTFSVIGFYYAEDTIVPGGMTIEIIGLIQTTMQTMLVIDGTSRRCKNNSHRKRKPGRQIITFLIIANMAMWMINTLEKGHAMFRPSHLKFFGLWTWTVITHVSMPLAIFYRFHSTICLFEIWKSAYKKQNSKIIRAVVLRLEVLRRFARDCIRHPEGEISGNFKPQDHGLKTGNKHTVRDTLTVSLSAFYGKLLIVLGLALPVTAAVIPDATVTYDGFYLYLYLGSLLFLLYMYAGVMTEEVVQSVSRKTSAFEMSSKRLRTPGTAPQQQVKYGSFYLRMGVAGFGVGSMIHACLHFGMYFELKSDSACNEILVAITPLAHAAFIIMQMIFIFSDNNKLVEEYSYTVVTRFGLMHMIATNLCEWLYVVVEETKYDILKFRNSTDMTEENDTLGNWTHTPDIHPDCWNTYIMEPLARNASEFLFPCTVEYSLLCAVILGVMWMNACSDPSKPKHKDSTASVNYEGRQSGVNIIYSRSVSQYSVDCASAHKGLFAGIIVLVLSIVCLIMFFELIKFPEYVSIAVFQVNVWETVLFFTTTVATFICGYIIKDIGIIRSRRKLELEHIVLLVTQTGVVLYFMFQIIGEFFSLESRESWAIMRIVTPMAAMIQSICQTMLVLDAWRRRCDTKKHMTDKPGKQLVTFLLISNLAMWVISRLKNGRAEFYPLQLKFYGVWAWTIITHVSLPLVVCYRFQSTVCLYEIWKHVYKTRSS